MEIKEEKKTYRYPYRDIYIDINGKKHDVKAKSKAELKKKIKAIDIRAKRETVPCRGEDIPMYEFALYCIETYKTGQNEETQKKYINRVKRCILEAEGEGIGHIPLKDITADQCQRVLNRQKSKSKTQINDTYNALKFIFRHAVAQNRVSTDPTKNLVKPRAKTPEKRRALTPYERQIVLEVGKTNRKYYLFLLMLFCGCRPGEAAEAKGSDILKSGDLYLLHIRGTKTDNSDRQVPIPPTLLEIIKDTPPHEYIAQSVRGNRLNRTGRRKAWAAFKKELNIAMGCKVVCNELVPPYPLADDLVPYCFRHEYCTELARQGVDIRMAQIMMGHSDISLTANIYTNLNSIEAARNVASIMGCTGEERADT